jgi:pectin methylesterase-like acyl-CoA thioesterase
MPARRARVAATGLAAAASLRAQSSAGAGVVHAVVALDGSGDFPTIQRAVDHILDHAPRDLSRAILEIRPGVYRERVNVPRDKVNFNFAGVDAASTVPAA